MMQEHTSVSGFLVAATNAAEMARRYLHPELKGQHGGGCALPAITGVDEQAVIPPEWDWALLAKERASRDARVRAQEAAIEIERIAQAEHARIQFEKMTADAEAAVELFGWL